MASPIAMDGSEDNDRSDNEFWFRQCRLGCSGEQMNNYEFCTQWVLEQESAKRVHVLDYGCGSGQIVKELRKREINAFGCDTFYEGGDYSKSVDTELLDNCLIKRMEGNAIPYDCASFDFVINNQVMEHVENLDIVLAEIQRVLKPGGLVLSLFPDKSVWREGHCGIPLLHRFPKNSRIRVYYAAGFRIVGFGYHKGDKKVMRWSQEFCEWLDKWTRYRPRREVDSTYSKYFLGIEHIEDYWLRLRLGRKKALAAWLPTSIQNLIVNKLGGMVFVARKPVKSGKEGC
jgi:SAM-dependent methyltransferase